MHAPENSANSGWLPLGKAALIDWARLNRPGSTRGATVWVKRIRDEPVLLRRWSDASTHFFEFLGLTDDRLIGTFVVSVTRLEPTRLRLKGTLDVEGRLGWSDVHEFEEHAKTGLLRRVSRTLDLSTGTPPMTNPPSPSPTIANAFETMSEAAFSIGSGAWIAEIISNVQGILFQPEVTSEPPVSVSGSVPATAPIQRERQAPADVRNLMEALESRGRATGPQIELVRTRPLEIEKGNGNGAGAKAAKAPPEPSAQAAAHQNGKGEKVAPDSSRRRAAEKSVPVLFCTTAAGDSYEVTEAETYMGRSKQCTIVLNSQRVSRKHACITKEADGFYINDLGAANGIWAGTAKVERERIDDGDEFIVGDILVTFGLR